MEGGVKVKIAKEKLFEVIKKQCKEKDSLKTFVMKVLASLVAKVIILIVKRFFM